MYFVKDKFLTETFLYVAEESPGDCKIRKTVRVFCNGNLIQRVNPFVTDFAEENISNGTVIVAKKNTILSFQDYAVKFAESPLRLYSNLPE